MPKNSRKISVVYKLNAPLKEQPVIFVCLQRTYLFDERIQI